MCSHCLRQPRPRDARGRLHRADSNRLGTAAFSYVAQQPSRLSAEPRSELGEDSTGLRLAAG